MRYFKDRAFLTGAQAVLDLFISTIFLLLQFCSIFALGLFVYMGARLVVKSYAAFKIPVGEASGLHQHVPAPVDPESEPDGVGEDGRKLDPVGEALHVAFQGFEFLLFAPLSFLLLRSLTQYIIDLTMRDCLYTDANIKGPSNAALLRDVGRQSLFDTKALSIGLLFAIVATHMVAGFLAGRYGSEADWKEIVVGGVLLVILSTSYLCMERLTHHRGRPPTGEPGDHGQGASTAA